MSRHLQVNDVLTSASSKRIVLSINSKHDLVDLYVPETCATEQESLRTLRTELAAGRVTSDAAKIVSGTVRNVANDSAAYKTFLFRLALVHKIKAMVASGKSNGEAIGALKNTVLTLASGETLPMCSQREAYRILKLNESTEGALMPAYETRGNRASRYGLRMSEIVLELTATMYATEKSKITIAKLADLVTHCAHTEGILDDEKHVSRKFVRSMVIQKWNPDLDHKRLDPRLAKSLKAVAANRIRPGAPLNRVEIDTLHLPMLAKTEYGIAEDMHVILAIDCETSHPLAWWLMLTKPTTEDTFSCLERAIYPKTELLKKMGINFSVDPFGAILNLIMDNGPENSKIRLAPITRVGTNPVWTEKDSGHRKPFVERLNRSLKIGLEALPGCTRFDGKDGMRTEAAKKDALMTVKTFEHWIARWLFEKWPHTPLERFVTADYVLDEPLGLTPAERWCNYEARQPLPICPPLEDWRRCRYLEVEKVLNNKTGVSLESFDFRGDNLKALIAQYGPNSQVKAFYNPHDYRTIYVPEKKSGEWTVLINSEVISTTPAFSFDEAKKRRKAVKGTYSPSPIAKKFDADMCEKILEKRPKKRNRSDALSTDHQTTRAQDAMNRARENPLPNRQETPFYPDSYIAEDAIPSFATHHKTPREKS